MGICRMLEFQYLTKSIIFLRRFSFIYTFKAYLILQVILCVQILSIVFPPFELNSPKWDYKNIGPVFLAIGFTARPLTLSHFVSVHLHLAYIFLIGVITCMLGIVYTIFIYEQRMTTIYVETFNELNKIAKFIGWLRLLLLDIGYVPTVYLVVQGSLSESITITLEIAAVFYISLTICDILFLRPNSWDEVYTVISWPVYELMQKAMICALIVALDLVQYGSYPREYSFTLILYGSSVCGFYYFRMPYANLGCNTCELLKGVALGLSGVLNLIYHEMLLSYDTKFNITMVYFMILPIACYIARELLANKYSKLTLGTQNSDEISEVKLFHLLYRNRDNEDFNAYESILVYINQSQSKNIYIWYLQYCISKDLWADSQIAIASFYSLYSQSKKHSYIEEYKQSIILSAELKNSYLYKSYEFIKLQMAKAQLVKGHNLSCFYISKLVKGLLHKKLNISELSRLIPILYSQIKHTDRLYIYLIQKQRQNCKLLSRYSKFLQAICHPTKSLSFNLLSLECKEQSHLANQRDLNFYNNSTVIFYMRSTKNCFKIYKAKNVKHLGYSKDDLKHKPIYDLFPRASKEFYRRVCQESMSLGSESNLFYRTHEIYLLNSKEFMMPMIIMYSLIASSNKLEIMANCMMNTKGLAIAYLSEDGRYIEFMVTYIQTYGMNVILADYFMVEMKYVKSLDFLNCEDDWFDGMIIGHLHHVIFIQNTLGILRIKTCYFHDMESVTIKSIVAEVMIHGYYQLVYESDIQASNLGRLYRTDSIVSNPESTLYKSHKSEMKEIINDTPAVLKVSSLTEPIYSELKNFIDTNIQTLRRTFRALLILISIVTMLNLASYFLLYSIIQKETKFYYEGSYLTKDIFKLRMISDQYSILSKQIYLVDSGVDILKNRTQIQTSILNFADQVLVMLQNIKDTDLDEEFIELLYQNQYPWWSYNEGSFSVTHKNILDTMYHMVSLARDLASQQNITHNTQSFMEIYRNCPSETRKAFIELTLQSIQNHIVWYDKLENNLEYTLGMVCLLLSVINIGAVLYLFYRISIVRKNFWTHIRTIPIHFISDLLHLASPSHQGYSRKHEVSNAAGHSNLIHQKCLYIFGALFCIVIPGVMLYISYSLVPMAISYLKDSFVYINAAGFQRSMIKNSYFLLRENYTPLDILYSNSYFSYTPGEVIESLDALKEMQQVAFEARYLSASIEEVFLNSRNDKNRTGLYYAVSDYRFMVMDCLEYLKTDWKIGNQRSLEIEKVTDEIVNEIRDLIGMIDEELMRRLEECLDRLLRELVGISLGIVGFVFGVMIPVILKIRKMLKAETKCLIYLPK